MRKGIVVACCLILVITCGYHGVALQEEEHPSGSSTEVRIFAAYFPYGRGIAEGFAYHPGEQDVGHTGDPNSEKLAAIFYGNKFVHVSEGLTPGDNPNALQTNTFPWGSLIIPMDDKQGDVVLAFGFMHALLRNGTNIYRIIEPPDVRLKTQGKPSGDFFKGGPVLVYPADRQTFLQVHQSFPSVSYDTLWMDFTSNRVFKVGKPTNILIIKGANNWGHTEQLLAKMKIPYALKYTSDINNNPDILMGYDLAVDDCGGWDTKYGGTLPAAVAAKMREFAAKGGEMIYTDRAMGELEIAFPGYIPVVTYGPTATWDVTMVNVPEFPGQYYGNPTVKMWQLASGADMGLPVSKDVRVMAYQSPSGGTPTITLTAPNGGTLVAGSQTQITWTASGGTGTLTVDLEYSVSGQNGPWVELVKRTGNTGSFSWNVPYIPTTEGYIRATVWDTYWRSSKSMNTNPFTISSPQLKLEVNAKAGDYTLVSGGNTSVVVHVMDPFGNIEGANITLASSAGGSFNPATGKTDVNGNFYSVYTAPTTGTKLTDHITASASKSGYVDGMDGFDLYVNPGGQASLNVDLRMNPPFLHSGDVGYLNVKVTDGSIPVSDASLTLSTNEGYITPATGVTNATGEAYFAYTPLTTSVPIEASLVAIAKKTNYLDGIGRVTVLINPLLDLMINASVEKQQLSKGEKSKVFVHVQSNSFDIEGSKVEFTLAGSGSLSANSGTTNSTGEVVIEYLAPPAIPNKQSPTVFITATKPGYTTAKASVFFNLQPDPKLDVSIIPEKTSLNSSESTDVRILVNSQGTPVSDASVSLLVSDGSIIPASGKTNSTGVMSARYTAPVVGSQITAIIDANASKSGFINGTGSAAITIYPVPVLDVSIASNTTQVDSGGTATITVTVTENANPISNATVRLSATQGGVIPDSGKTDTAGKFVASFQAPNVTAQTVVTITANASKSGFTNGSQQLLITVNPKGSVQKQISVTLSADPASLKAGETSDISVMATGGSSPLEGGTVTITVSGGVIDPDSGVTDASGRFSSVFTAPDTSVAKDITIEVTVKKSGYTTGKGSIKVHVDPWTGEKKDMTLSITASKTTLAPLEESAITVTVKEGLVGIPGVKIVFKLNDGEIHPVSGYSDAQGNLIATFTAPNVTSDTVVTIEASATKAGYNPASATLTLTIKPGSGPKDNDTNKDTLSPGVIALIGLGIGLGVFMILLLYLMKMKKKCTRCGRPIPRGMKDCPVCQAWRQNPFQQG